MTPRLEITGVAVEMGGRPILSGVNLRLEAGELVGVVGPNGSGKTSLLRAALGLIPLRQGRVALGGRDLASLDDRGRAGLAAYQSQDRKIGWNMPAWRIAALGAGARGTAAREAAVNALAEVGIADLADRGARDMSGGERARVLVARLLVTGAPLLVADEPVSGLDPAAQFMILDLLRRRTAAGAAALVSLHDLTLAARACDRLAVLAHGRLVAVAPPREALCPTVLHEAFGLCGELAPSPAGIVLAARRSR